MRVVVTGGAGFIGQHVVVELASRSHDVVAFDSLRSDVHPPGSMPPSDLPLAVGDVRDPSAVAHVIAGADAVVHLAAKVGLGVDLSDMDDYVSSNDHGTSVLLRVAASVGLRRLVQASSMVVYGEGRYECPSHGVVPPAPRERAQLQAGRFDPPCPICCRALLPGLVAEDAPLDPRNTYAATKVAQEHLAAIWARECSGAAVSLRLHNVYGPGMPRDTPYAGVASIFSSALDRGEAPRVFEDGGQRRDFVHVTDVARAFADALESTGAARVAGGSHRAYNVGSGLVSTVGDMARALSSARGGPEPVVTGEFRTGDVRHVTASSQRIADEIGWRARVSLADGVRGLTFSG